MRAKRARGPRGTACVSRRTSPYLDPLARRWWRTLAPSGLRRGPRGHPAARRRGAESRSSPLHDPEGDHAGDDLREAGAFRDADDVLHVLVRAGGLLDDPRLRGRVEIDPFVAEGLHDFIRAEHAFRGLAGHL